MTVDRWRVLLPALWAGWLLCVALLATPAPFSALTTVEAGRVVGRMFAQEAYTALLLGVLLLVLERVAARRACAAGVGSQFSSGMVLCLGTLFCTVAGYFVLQPMMTAARTGQGVASFGQLHAVSLLLFVVKTGLVLGLAWRATRPTAASLSPRPSS
ncbi:MAG: DUF4149 domain-containing protein [Chitinophagaceae bacterium]|nr:DUF4149 domain-containing protein [Rubrivivax sp.]